MTSHHERLTGLFLQASSLGGEERRKFLERTCRDPELRAEVMSLLEHGEDVPEILTPGALAAIVSREPSARPGRIGPYRILDRLGDGAMGVVFLAEQNEPIKRLVAIKVLKLGIDTDEVIARFDSERRALAMMDHPNIARVYEAGTTPEGRPYFAMEYVDGKPVAHYCDERRLTVRQRLELFLQICEGVQHAHQKGIIHRDLKPSNVLVKVQGGSPVPKIIDFGIAKATQQRLTERTLYTAAGMLLGTPGYMSPEQAALDGRDIDTRTDVYSLGVMLYELLAGTLPFGADELRDLGFDEIRRRIREEEPPRPSERSSRSSEVARAAAHCRRVDPQELKRQLAGDLDWVTMKALEKDRARRYASVVELVADIRRHLQHEPVLAGPPSAAYRARKFVRRHRASVFAAGLVLFALVLGLSGTTFGLLRAVEAEGRARHDARISNQITDFLLEIFESTPANRLRSTSATDVLERGIAKVRGELGDQPVLQALLMHKIGKLHLDIGLLREAAPLLESAHGQLETLLGPDDRETLLAMNTLARSHMKLHRNGEAEALYLETLRRQRAVLGPEHPDPLTTAHDLAFLYKTLGRHAEAAGLFEQAFRGRLRALGPDDPETLLSQGLLGSVYLDLDRLEECRSVLLGALDRMRAIDHPEMPNVLYNLGCVAARQGERGRALEYLARAVDGGTGGMLIDDPHLSALSGDPELERLARRRGYGHDLGRTARDLGHAYARQGRHAEAEPLLLGAAESLERRLGPNHPDTLIGRALVGELYIRQGRYEEAEPLALRYLDWLQRDFGSDFYEVGYVLWHLAQCRVGSGDTESAIEMFERAAAILDKAGFRGEASLRRASAQALSGNPAAALRSLKAALELGGVSTDLVQRDLAFRSLRNHREFAKILASLPSPRAESPG